MYSRSTERRGRTNLPPGYDGNAFRHDTGERRPLYPTETKIHSPREATTEELANESKEAGAPENEYAMVDGTTVDRSIVDRSSVARPQEKKADDTFLAGMIEHLGKEEWLLLFLILLLLADGSDAWEIILLLAVLLAVGR